MTENSDPQMLSQGPQSFTLPGARSWLLPDAGGDPCRIDIAIPEGPPPVAGWPAIFLLDGAGCFATCVEAMRRMARRTDATGVSPAVVVGISHAAVSGAGSNLDAISRRKRDFASGEGFLDFLCDTAKPLVARQAPIDAGRLTLFGHSLGGYFVLRVLAGSPEAFRTYAAISPSIWSGRAELLEKISGLHGQHRQLLICVGEWEDALPPWQLAAPGSAEVAARRKGRQMIAHAQDMSERMAAVLGAAHVQFRLLAEEDHASILSAAIPRMLRMASRPLDNLRT